MLVLTISFILAERSIFLRFLFTTPHWKDSISKYIKDSISSIPKLVNLEQDNLKCFGEITDYLSVMAALTVLGKFIHLFIIKISIRR